MNKEIIKQGIAEAEKEAQEEQIKQVKNIVQTILENIQKYRKTEDEAREKRKILEKDLDNLKAGRLDLIEERQNKDPRAKEISVIIIKKIEKEYVPMYPWRSPWVVELKSPYNHDIVINGYGSTATSIGNSMQALCTTNTISGQVFTNFVSGSYNVGNGTVNL